MDEEGTLLFSCTTLEQLVQLFSSTLSWTSLQRQQEQSMEFGWSQVGWKTDIFHVNKVYSHRQHCEYVSYKYLQSVYFILKLYKKYVETQDLLLLKA